MHEYGFLALAFRPLILGNSLTILTAVQCMLPLFAVNTTDRSYCTVGDSVERTGKEQMRALRIYIYILCSSYFTVLLKFS